MTRVQLIDELMQDDIVENIINKNYNNIPIDYLREYLPDAYDYIQKSHKESMEDYDTDDELDNCFNVVGDVSEYLQNELYGYVKDNYKIKHPYLIEV